MSQSKLVNSKTDPSTKWYNGKGQTRRRRGHNMRIATFLPLFLPTYVAHAAKDIVLGVTVIHLVAEYEVEGELQRACSGYPL